MLLFASLPFLFRHQYPGSSWKPILGCLKYLEFALPSPNHHRRPPLPLDPEPISSKEVSHELILAVRRTCLKLIKVMIGSRSLSECHRSACQDLLNESGHTKLQLQTGELNSLLVKRRQQERRFSCLELLLPAVSTLEWLLLTEERTEIKQPQRTNPCESRLPQVAHHRASCVVHSLPSSPL